MISWHSSRSRSRRRAEINAVKAQYAKGGQKAVTDPEFPNARLMVPALEPYAGQQVLTGKEAQVYANDFIGQHLYAMPYSRRVLADQRRVSGARSPGARRPRRSARLSQTAFMGTTLRGMLLEAYAFGTIGTVMLWGAVAAFAGAAVLLILIGLGIWHANRTSAEERLFDELQRTESTATKEPIA